MFNLFVILRDVTTFPSLRVPEACFYMKCMLLVCPVTKIVMDVAVLEKHTP